MNQQTALRVAVLAGVASLATVGLLGYRLLNQGNQTPDNIPPDFISSRQ